MMQSISCKGRTKTYTIERYGGSWDRRRQILTSGHRVIRCQAENGSNPGDKVLPMLRDASDWILLPGRVALGAVLSTNENLSRLPEDVEKVSTLLSDPRPIEEKQREVFGEIEDRVAGFLTASLNIENEVIMQIDGVLPQEAKDAMPEPLRNFLTVREVTSLDYNADSKPLATWTITSMDEEDGEVMTVQDRVPYSGSRNTLAQEEAVDVPPASAATVAESQAAAEMVEIQSAVMAVREQLDKLQNNKDEAQIPMIKLNLREATQSLARRLEQRSGVLTGKDASAAAAIAEAQELLEEVENLE